MLNFRKESDSFSVPSQMNNDLSSDTNKYIDTKSKISSVSDTKFYPNTDKLKSIRELKITNPIVDDDSVQDLSDGEGHGVPNVIDIGKLKSLNLKKSSDELEKYKDSTFDADSFENLSDGEGILVDDVKNISKLKSKLSGEIDSKINIDGSINSIENLFSNSDEKVVPNIKQNEVSWKKMFSIDNTRFDELLKKSMEYQVSCDVQTNSYYFRNVYVTLKPFKTIIIFCYIHNNLCSREGRSLVVIIFCLAY